MLNELTMFTALFKRLQSRVKDSPISLSWLAEENSGIRELAFRVGQSAAKIERYQAEKSDKHTVYPEGYITAWTKYENRYRPTIRNIVEAEWKDKMEEFLQELKETAEAKNEDADSMLDDILARIEASKNPGDSFDPLEDDPAELIDRMFYEYRDIAANHDIFPDDWSDKAIGAWYFFDKTLGLDHRAIYKRWKSVPELLIPRHALSVNHLRIEELYNEAARTYVFGSKMASISMCRALLEHILKEHFKIEERKLGKMITVAEGRFNQFRKLNLHGKCDLANRVMHNYEKQSDLEDRSVLDFLKTIRAIVKIIPK